MPLFLDEIEKRRKAEMEAIKALAFQKARAISEMLRARYGVKKVILFGSIVEGDYLHKGTDIDLLVEGLNPEDFLKAGAEAMKLASPFDVDMIPMEKADRLIKERAEKEGISL